MFLFICGGEALLTACYIQNRITSKKTDVSLYEVWKC